MKGNLKKNKSPKVIIFVVFFVLIIALLPISFRGFSVVNISKNLSNAAPTFPNIEFTPEAETGANTPEAMDAIRTLEKLGIIKYNPAVNVSSFWETAVGYIIKAVVRAILAAVYLIFWMFYCVTYGLVYISEWVLGLILDPTFTQKLGGFTTAEFVKKTAQQVANLCNMVYLFVLMFIAISVMFGREEYKKLIVKLVIAALLTNFAIVISGLVIDASQVIMYSILDSSKSNEIAPYEVPGQTQGGFFNQGTRILDLMQIKLGVGEEIKNSVLGSFLENINDFYQKEIPELLSRMIKLSGLILFGLALTVTIGTITVILIIRIAMLWILLIVSPLAFLFSVLPQTQKWWEKWQESLFHYAFTGPILVFFLWFAFKVSQTIAGLNLRTSGARQSEDDFKFIFYNFFADNFSIAFQFLLLIIIIWAGILIANQWGIKGSKNLDGLIKSTMNLPKYVLGAGSVGVRALSGIAGAFGRFNYIGGKIIGRRGEDKLEDLMAARRLAGKKKDIGEVRKISGQIKDQKELMIRKEKSRIDRQKFFAALNPSLVKKGLSDFWKNSNKNYFEDSEAVLHEFSNKFFIDKLLLRKRRLIGKSGQLREHDLIGEENEIRKLHKDRESKNAEIKLIEKMLFDNKVPQGAIAEVQKNKDKLEKEVEDINKEIEKKTGSISNTITKNEKEKEGIKKSIEEDFAKEYVPADGFIKQDWIRRAGLLAKETKEEDWKSSLYQKELFEKEVQKAKEKIGKLGLTPEQMIRMVENGEGDRATQVALLRQIASSGKYFGDLLQKLTKVFNTDDLIRELKLQKPGIASLDTEQIKEEATKEAQNRALDFLENNASEMEVIAGIRAADAEARKAHNLSQIGYVNFDQISGKWRLSNEGERAGVVSKYVKDLRPDEFNQIHIQTFDDSVSRKALSKDTDWNYLSSNKRFLDNIRVTLKEKLLDNRNEIINHINEIKNDAERIKQRDGFERLAHTLESKTHP